MYYMIKDGSMPDGAVFWMEPEERSCFYGILEGNNLLKRGRVLKAFEVSVF